MNALKIVVAMGVVVLPASLVLAEGRVVGGKPSEVIRGTEPVKEKTITGLDTEKNGGTAGRGIGAPSLERLAAAENAFESVDTQLRAAFNDKPDMREAANALHAAQQRVNNAYAAVMKKLGADPAYVAANEKRNAAQKKLENLRANADKVAPSDITNAAADVMKNGSVVTKMQSDALRKDADHAEAKKTLAEASAKVSEMQKQLTDSLAANPDWVAKKKALDDARSKLTASK